MGTSQIWCLAFWPVNYCYIICIILPLHFKHLSFKKVYELQIDLNPFFWGSLTFFDSKFFFKVFCFVNGRVKAKQSFQGTSILSEMRPCHSLTTNCCTTNVMIYFTVYTYTNRFEYIKVLHCCTPCIFFKLSEIFILRPTSERFYIHTVPPSLVPSSNHISFQIVSLFLLNQTFKYLI